MILDAIWGVDNISIQIFEKWNFFGSGKWVFLGKFPKIGQISISRERRTLETHLTPQTDRKTHFSICISYIVYPSDDSKCPKMPKMCQNGGKMAQMGGQLQYLVNHVS